MVVHKTVFRYLAALLVTGSAILLSACASKGTAPVEQISAARASIGQAEGAGAMQLAPVELLTAREKLGKAEDAVREERYTDARRFAEEAEADAEVAERKARAAKASNAVEELARGNAALEKEIERRNRP